MKALFPPQACDYDGWFASLATFVPLSCACYYAASTSKDFSRRSAAVRPSRVGGRRLSYTAPCLPAAPISRSRSNCAWPTCPPWFAGFAAWVRSLEVVFSSGIPSSIRLMQLFDVRAVCSVSASTLPLVPFFLQRARPGRPSHPKLPRRFDPVAGAARLPGLSIRRSSKGNWLSVLRGAGLPSSVLWVFVPASTMRSIAPRSGSGASIWTWMKHRLEFSWNSRAIHK